MTTRDEILEMARKAGFRQLVDVDNGLDYIVPCCIGQSVSVELERFYRFSQAAAYERAAETLGRLISGDGVCASDGAWIHDCVEAVLALKEK